METEELVEAIIESLELLTDDPILDGRTVHVWKNNDVINVQIGYDTIRLRIEEDSPVNSGLILPK